MKTETSLDLSACNFSKKKVLFVRTEKGHKRAFTYTNHAHIFQQLKDAFKDQLGTSYEIFHKGRQIVEGDNDAIHLLPTYTTIQIVSARARGLRGGANHTTDRSDIHVKIHPDTEMFDHKEEGTRVGAENIQRQIDTIQVNVQRREDTIKVKCTLVPLDNIIGEDACQVECSKKATVEEFLEEAGA